MAEGRIKRMLGLCALILSVISLLVLYCAVSYLNSTQLYRAAAGFCVFLGSCLLSITLWDAHAQNPADSHCPRSLLIQYLIQRATLLIGARLANHLRSLASNTRQTQDQVLMDILKKASGTEYGLRFDFRIIHSREEFVKKVPLSTYDNYEEFVKRLENEAGARDAKLLTEEKVEYLGLTSGSSGKNKHMPLTKISKLLAAKKVGPLMLYNDYKRTGVGLGRVLTLGYGFELKRSESGIPLGPVSSYIGRRVPHALSPADVFNVADELIAIHLHAVFGLMEGGVERMDTLFSSLIYSFWSHVERHWVEICDSIESGVLTFKFRNNETSLAEIIGTEAVKEINSELKRRKSKTRADELRQEFSKGFKGIALRIWPRLRSVRCVNSGSFAQYAQVLDKVYMHGVPQVNTVHASTEGFLGINLTFNAPGDYTPLINIGFFEFIPEDHVHDLDPDTLFIDRLERGGRYEIVYTSPVGLYRYRTGDVVKIVDVLNQCPVYTFEYRVSQVLNVYWEKTPESVLHDSVTQAVDELKGRVGLVEYTTTESLLTSHLIQPSLHTKFYVFFLELTSDSDSFTLTDSDKLLFDEALRQNFEIYDSLRQNDSIGPVKVIQVSGGTFEKLRRSSAISIQHKQARVTRKKEEIEFLFSNRLQS